MAVEIAPALESLTVVDSWAGFRPRAKDGLPVLGPTRHVAGLFYATGHYRNGILLAPITGELIAEAILFGRDTAIAFAIFTGQIRLTRSDTVSCSDWLNWPLGRAGRALSHRRNNLTGLQPVVDTRSRFLNAFLAGKNS